MNPVMLKTAGVTDPGDPVGVKKALGEAEEVVAAEGKYFLLFILLQVLCQNFVPTFVCLEAFNLFTDLALKAQSCKNSLVFHQ